MTPENLNKFHGRQDMDLNTPHGQAQARFDEMVQVAQKFKTSVHWAAFGESPNVEPATSIEGDEIVIFQRKPQRAKDTNKTPKKELKTHDRTGLTGFYKGTYYRNGVPQKSNKKNR